MVDVSKIARPYAKAVFDLARDSDSLSIWRDILGFLGRVVQDSSVIEFIDNVNCTSQQQIDLMLEILADAKLTVDKVLVVNFLNVLTVNKRLAILADIFAQYEFMRSQYEKIIDVKVLSYASLTQNQENKLVEKLTKRLHRKVSLQVKIDESLQGGMIVCAGDLVFDASVKTQLQKLSTCLQA